MSVIQMVAITASILLPNVFVSIYLVRRNEFEVRQKIIQIVIVWLFPIIGAIGMFAIVKYLVRNTRYKTEREFGGGTTDHGFS